MCVTQKLRRVYVTRVNETGVRHTLYETYVCHTLHETSVCRTLFETYVYRPCKHDVFMSHM